MERFSNKLPCYLFLHVVSSTCTDRSVIVAETDSEKAVVPLTLSLPLGGRVMSLAKCFLSDYIILCVCV